MQSYGIINTRLDIHYYLPIKRGASLDNALFFCQFFRANSPQWRKLIDSTSLWCRLMTTTNF